VPRKRPVKCFPRIQIIEFIIPFLSVIWRGELWQLFVSVRGRFSFNEEDVNEQ
jgi:hypothetical protein